MFSNVTNQMSSWLGTLGKKQTTTSDEIIQNQSENADLITDDQSEKNNVDHQESKTETPTSQKSVKGSIDEQDDRSSTTEGADSEISSVATESPDEEKAPFTQGIHNVDLSGVSNKALEGAKSLGSFLFSAVNKAGKTVTEASAKIKKSVGENSMLSDFNREQEAFVKHKDSKTTEVAVPPWVGYSDEEILKEQILALSTDRRNFVRSPPSGVQFQFDFDATYPVALATLSEDPNLEKMRYDLVPKKIKEEVFWRNYFYRVSLIRQSTELSSMAQEGGQHSHDSSRTSSVEGSGAKEGGDDELHDQRPDSPAHEFVSDLMQPSNEDLAEVKEGLRKLGVKEEDWEKELQAELQEYEVVTDADHKSDAEWESEIQQMLDAEDGDDLK